MAAATPTREGPCPNPTPGKARKRSPRMGSCNFPATRGLGQAACGHRGGTLGTLLASPGHHYPAASREQNGRRLLGDTNRGDKEGQGTAVAWAGPATLSLQVSSVPPLPPHPCHPVPAPPFLSPCPCHPPLQVPSVPALPSSPCHPVPEGAQGYSDPIPVGVQHPIPVTLPTALIPAPHL